MGDIVSGLVLYMLVAVAVMGAMVFTNLSPDGRLASGVPARDREEWERGAALIAVFWPLALVGLALFVVLGFLMLAVGALASLVAPPTHTPASKTPRPIPEPTP